MKWNYCFIECCPLYIKDCNTVFPVGEYNVDIKEDYLIVKDFLWTMSTDEVPMYTVYFPELRFQS